MNTLRLGEQDIQQTAKFVREFVSMSLVPWMEKNVADWNENVTPASHIPGPYVDSFICFQFASTRRLPSRLFSSTRRLFGSGASSPVPQQTHASSVSPVPSGIRSMSQSSISSIPAGGHPPLSQQRRLAEFATILGDLKLALSVWETLKKDGKGGSVRYTIIRGKDMCAQLSRFEGNASTYTFSVLCGKPSCLVRTLHGYIPRRRSISFGSTTCTDICCTLGGQSRFLVKPP